MREPGKQANAWTAWRIGRWIAALALLLTPLAMMQVSDEWHWEPRGFVLAGVVLGGIGLLYDAAERASGSRAYRAGVAVALLAAFLLAWSTVVRDDDHGIGFLLTVVAAAVAAFAARFRPDGMARAMFGIAVMQALVGIAIATAPSVAAVPGSPSWFLLYSGFFALLWLLSAVLFRLAAKRPAKHVPLHD